MRYDASATVDLDGTDVPLSSLRAGQVVVINAEGTPGEPITHTIAVRRAVIGQIQSIEVSSATMTIAGQSVLMPPRTWGADVAHLGDWVAVSGLRRTDGVIVASRFDRAPSGAFLVRGQVMRDGTAVRIGKLTFNGSAAASLRSGQFVTVSGRYVAGQAQPARVTLDPLFPNPTSYFGPSVNRLVVEGFVLGR